MPLNLRNPAALGAFAKGDLENAMVASTPGGIERQEKAGQGELVNSTNMPLELRPSREAFETVGFTFGEALDDVFMKATLPTGWKREASEHAMHSYILDEQGRKRVEVFYKAAFYDRRADAGLIGRYSVQSCYPDNPSGEGLAEDEIRHVVFDGGTEIHRMPVCKRSDWSAREPSEKAARAWLAERFPRADDPTAYWSES
jgi:hypothetical protein